ILVAPLSDRAAAVTVAESEGLVTRAFDPSTFRSSITYRGAPIVSLAQPYAPDEKWEVVRHAKHAVLVDDSKSATGLPQLERVCGAGSARCSALMTNLPKGDYLVVRTARPFEKSDSILMGNERV